MLKKAILSTQTAFLSVFECVDIYVIPPQVAIAGLLTPTCCRFACIMNVVTAICCSRNTIYPLDGIETKVFWYTHLQYHQVEIPFTHSMGLKPSGFFFKRALAAVFM